MEDDKIYFSRAELTETISNIVTQIWWLGPMELTDEGTEKFIKSTVREIEFWFSHAIRNGYKPRHLGSDEIHDDPFLGTGVPREGDK